MIPGYSAKELAGIVQGSDEWIFARIGCVGASGIKAAVATRKKGDGELAERYSYKMQIVAERIGSVLTPHFVTDAMRWGIENEPVARTAYELRFGAEVDTVGIVAHPDIDMTLCSPDGLVGDDGLIEIKCPMTATHCDYMIAGTVPKEYEPQVHWQMACTGRKWCDFVSFDPRLPERFQMFRVRVERNEKRIAELEDGVRHFLSEVDAVIAALEAANPPKERLRQDLAESVALTGDWEQDLRLVADSLHGDVGMLQ